MKLILMSDLHNGADDACLNGMDKKKKRKMTELNWCIYMCHKDQGENVGPPDPN